MTAASLRSHTARDLAHMARLNGIVGWHSMRKEELVGALVKLARKRALTTSSTQRSSVAINTDSIGKLGAAKTDPQVLRRINQLQSKLATVKNLAASQPDDGRPGPRQDRLVVMVRDPYWLHAVWELSQHSVDRAQAAMGPHWHTAQPTLRLFRIMEAGASTHERDIVIHGGVSNWYVDVNEPPCQFRTEIGYLGKNGVFHCLARSNTVQTPPASTSDAVDENWADVAEHADRIYAMSGGYSPGGTSRELQELLEERLRRPLGSPMSTRYGHGAASLDGSAEKLRFAIDAEVIVYGAANRDAHVTLKGEPVQLRSDGTFAVRLSLPDKRQVIPIVVSSADGVEQRTVILAVERNTKRMEPVVRDITR
ncbi:MAG: DUF4912 domain-containing protein [Aeoliella sp.]